MCLCFLFTREFWLGEADPPSDVKEEFATFSSTEMSTKHLHSFLVHRQGNTEEEARKIVETIFGSKIRPTLSLKDFHHYLFDVELNPAIKASSEVRDDMCAPLSHYYVFTGHNSYLTGNQLTSDSGVDPIIKALQRGVRVIELDIWPNSSDDDIDVYHGNTITSRVKFIDCLEAIKEHAFSTSPYPVVLNLENHLTPDFQAKAAKMITETFGDLLFFPKSGTKMDEFPSPQSLMNRIIVSAEPPDDEEEEEDKKESRRQVINRTPEYKNIITIKDGKPQDGLLKEALNNIDSNDVGQLNIGESDLEEASESYAPDMARFSQKNIIRVYPKGLRIDSSNYDPFPGWINGAQMVAFNMQGDGRFLWLMHGFFLANGGSGYVKKPDFLLPYHPHPHPHPHPTVTLPVKKTLKVKICTGHGWRSDFTKTYFDICSLPDFYVEIGIAGVPSDAVISKTKTVGNSWTPVWKEEFIFPLTVPELAVLSIEVRDSEVDRDDFAGQVCFPVSELKPGIRAVSLLDGQGNKYKSVKLLMRFDIT